MGSRRSRNNGVYWFVPLWPRLWVTEGELGLRVVSYIAYKIRRISIRSYAYRIREGKYTSVFIRSYTYKILRNLLYMRVYAYTAYNLGMENSKQKMGGMCRRAPDNAESGLERLDSGS